MLHTCNFLFWYPRNLTSHTRPPTQPERELTAHGIEAVFQTTRGNIPADCLIDLQRLPLRGCESCATSFQGPVSVDLPTYEAGVWHSVCLAE